MRVPDSLRALAEAWPPPRRGLVGWGPPREVPEALEPVLRGIVASADERWALVLLFLSGAAEGALRERLHDAIEGLLAGLPARRWVRLDEMSRPTWGTCVSIPWDEGTAFPRVTEAIRAGARSWAGAANRAAITASFGAHAAARLLATMHANGRVREAAVGSLAGDVRAIPALLLRANDWVGPVRDAAAQALRPLLDPIHAGAWVRALPLLLRLEECGRAEHGGLLDRAAELFRDGQARAQLVEAIRAPDAPAARAAATLALRVFGASDREVVAAVLRCPDVLVRHRALSPTTQALDDGLLETALLDPVPSVRRRALDVLRVRDPGRFLERLPEACLDRSAAVREYAVFHLRKAGRFDAGALATEAVARLRSGRGDPLGPLGFLCEVEGDEHLSAIEAFAGHRRGQVRLLAKQRLLRRYAGGRPVDPRFLDDPSPKVARRLLGALRAAGVEPDVAALAGRVAADGPDSEACAWLGTLAACGTWDALPHLVRALGDRREAVASAAQRHVDAVTRLTFRSYVTPGEGRLRGLADALRTCADPRSAAVAAWVRGVTGRTLWPADRDAG